jgi:hypothetical protein
MIGKRGWDSSIARGTLLGGVGRLIGGGSKSRGSRSLSTLWSQRTRDAVALRISRNKEGAGTGSRITSSVAYEAALRFGLLTALSKYLRCITAPSKFAMAIKDLAWKFKEKPIELICPAVDTEFGQMIVIRNENQGLRAQDSTEVALRLAAWFVSRSKKCPS